jgi:hypothetical protein
MTSFRLLAAFLCAVLFSSCQTANSLLQVPGNLLSSVGRALHVDNDRTPGDASIQAVEAKQAQGQVAMEQGAAKGAVIPGSEVAAR